MQKNEKSNPHSYLYAPIIPEFEVGFCPAFILPSACIPFRLLLVPIVKQRLLHIPILVALCLWNIVPGIGQTVLHHNDPANIRNLDHLFQVTVDNYLPQSSSVILKIAITHKEGVLLAEGVSRPFVMNTGQFMLNGDIRGLVNFSFTDGQVAAKNLQTTGLFPVGTYLICYQILTVNDNYELGSYCVDADIKPEAGNTPLTTSDKTKPVRFGGTSELLFNYANTQSSFTNLPPTYLNWTLSPQLSVLDIPVSARLFLTTQQSGVQQNMNSFTLQFDVNQFREILKQKLLNYISKNKALSKVGGIDFSSYITELDNIKNILGNENVINEINQLRELDSLQQILDAGKNITGELNSGYQNIQSNYNNVRDKWHSLKGDSLSTQDTISQLLISDSLYTRYTDQASDTYNKVRDSLGSVKDSLMRWKDKVIHTTDSLRNRVDQYLQNPSQLGEAGLDSLKKRVKALQWLESKREYYDKLIERKNKIEGYARKFGMLDSAGNISVPNAYKDIDAGKLSDPDYLYSKLKSHKLMRKMDKILYAVRNLSIGMGTPFFSSLTINGMAVNGITVEVAPFNFYGAFTYGEISNPVYTGNINYASYRRNIIGGKFGYGEKEKSHLHITVLSATDDSASINPRDSLYLYYKRPQDNKVISIDGQLRLFKNKLTVAAELSGSQTIKDLSNYGTNNILNGGSTSEPGDWLVNIITQRHDVNKAVVDYAIQARIEGSLFKDRTVISASFKRIGPDYYSFGLPFLVRDMMTFELKLSQKLWKNRITLTGFVRRNNNNLDGEKMLTTQFYTWGFDVNIRMPKWPSFRASMTPLMLQNDSSTFNLIAINANSTYAFRIRKLQNVASLTFLKQFGMSDDSLYRFDFTNVNLSYTMNIKQGPSIQLNSGYMGTSGYMGRKDTWIIGTGTSMTFFKIWNNTLGGNLYVNQQELKWGAYYQTSISILKYLVFSLRAENNQFNTYTLLPGLTDYTQFNLRTILTAKW